MKIAIIFSSPTLGTPEYRNVWDNCPKRQEIDAGKLLIKGTGWKIFVFDGHNKNYYDGAWNFETLKREVTGILEEHAWSSLCILLHGNLTEITSLIEQLQIPDPQTIYSRWYTKTRGKFYKKYIMPFSNDGSDDRFEDLWAEVKKTRGEEHDDFDFKGQLNFISHRLYGMIRWMRMVVEDATEDVNVLQDFRKFDFEFILKEYEKIESEVVSLDIPEIGKTGGFIKDIQKIKNEILKKNILSLQDLNLASDCLEKCETLHNALNQAEEAIHG